MQVWSQVRGSSHMFRTAGAWRGERNSKKAGEAASDHSDDRSWLQLLLRIKRSSKKQLILDFQTVQDGTVHSSPFHHDACQQTTFDITSTQRGNYSSSMVELKWRWRWRFCAHEHEEVGLAWLADDSQMSLEILTFPEVGSHVSKEQTTSISSSSLLATCIQEFQPIAQNEFFSFCKGNIRRSTRGMRQSWMHFWSSENRVARVINLKFIDTLSWTVSKQILRDEKQKLVHHCSRQLDLINRRWLKSCWRICKGNVHRYVSLTKYAVSWQSDSPSSLLSLPSLQGDRQELPDQTRSNLCFQNRTACNSLKLEMSIALIPHLSTTALWPVWRSNRYQHESIRTLIYSGEQTGEWWDSTLSDRYCFYTAITKLRIHDWIEAHNQRPILHHGAGVVGVHFDLFADH